MPRTILIAECMQEISSFNPLPSGYRDFTIGHGAALLRQRGLNTTLGGALAVLEARDDITVLPTVSARAGSAGTLSAEGWAQLAAEVLGAVLPHAGAVDGIYISLHGAMGAYGEMDPEGFLLEALRSAFGPDVPIVISLDLHGILTRKMIEQIDGLAIYQTYPHVDFADTGARAARLLLEILDRDLRPVLARVRIPMLARGDECITKTGWYGDVLAEGQMLEHSGQALAAGVMIGNPFTDVSELCTQAIVVARTDAELAAAAATGLAEAMWAGRARLTGKLIAPDKAVALARHMQGPVIFTDAADATSSGASGDSNVLLKALQAGGYSGSVLAQIVDAPAARLAHAAGVGAEITVAIGGSVDRGRFSPTTVTARVESLSRGQARLETMGLPLDAGPTAVLSFGTIALVVISNPVFLFDRAIYFANGLDPQDFDLIVVKSPHTEFHMYDQWAQKTFNVDAPGSTSANLASLGHQRCARPIYPIEPHTTFTPRAEIYQRRSP